MPPAGVPTSGKAIASLICGIFTLFFPASIAAIILGHLSLSAIRKSAGRLGGRGVAIAGLVLGYAGITLIPLILIIAAIAIPICCARRSRRTKPQLWARCALLTLLRSLTAPNLKMDFLPAWQCWEACLEHKRIVTTQAFSIGSSHTAGNTDMSSPTPRSIRIAPPSRSFLRKRLPKDARQVALPATR